MGEDGLLLRDKKKKKNASNIFTAWVAEERNGFQFFFFNKALNLWRLCNNIDENISPLWWFTFIAYKRVKYGIKWVKTVFFAKRGVRFMRGVRRQINLCIIKRKVPPYFSLLFFFFFFIWMYNMLFCSRPAHWDLPTNHKGNSLLNWNHAIYRPKRWHFIIQETLTPWMSNTRRCGGEEKAMGEPALA